jgi:hypothetical protein
VLLASPGGLTREQVSRLLVRIGAEAEPLAAWRSSGLRAGRLRLELTPESLQRGTDLGERPGARRRTDREREEADAAQVAARVFPNDRLRLFLRHDGELPPNLPASLTDLLRETPASLDLIVDADGYADLTGLGLERRDVLGQTPRELAEEVTRRLRFDYLVDVTVSGVTSRKAEVPGGRVRATLDDLAIDRNPFRPGDVVRLDLGDGRRIESPVADDGSVHLGRLGRFAAEGRSAGALQRDVIAKSAGDSAGTPSTDPEAEPPAVTNMTQRRAADRDAGAQELVAVLVILVEQHPTTPTTTAPIPNTPPVTPPPATAPAPATRPMGEWSLD